MFKVLTTNGDTHLGGSNVGHNVMLHYIDLIQRRDGIDVSTNRWALQRLRREAKRAKCMLLLQLLARLNVEDMVPGKTLSTR